jgi:hypothetical protein
MDLKIFTSLKRYLVLMILLGLLVPSGRAFSNEMNMDPKFSLINYSNPYREFYAPLEKEDLLSLSGHEIMVSNKAVLDKLGKIIISLKGKRNRLPKPKNNMGYFLRIELHNKVGDYYVLYANRDGGFELEDLNNKVHEGGFQEKVYKELVAICESLIDIADVKYQWRRMIE